MIFEQHSFNQVSPFSSTHPVHSDGQLAHTGLENGGLFAGVFDQFNKDISDSIDNNAIYIPDFFSAQHHSNGRQTISMGDSILDQNYQRHANSAHLENSQGEFNFLHEFQREAELKNSFGQSALHQKSNFK